MEKRISIKTALMLPFAIFVGILIVLLVFVWKRDYDWLAKEQGTKMAIAVNETTQQKLNELLMDPERVNGIFASQIKELELGSLENLNSLGNVALSYMKTVQTGTPQISVISYGDEKGRFVGVRANGADDISLMLKDEQTNGMLNIYEHETMDSAVVGAYEGYDVASRPWYAPVKTTPEPQWSEIYVNADEKMEITISSLMPVYDQSGKFMGVSDIDVKLNGITSFLRADKAKGSGVIYIIDNDWNLIAQSGEEPVMKLVKDATGNNAVEFIKAYSFESPLIKVSAEHLQKNPDAIDQVVQVDDVLDRLYVQMSEVPSLKKLGWKVITVIPENDLMGTVKSHQNTSLLIILILAALVGLIAAALISKIVQPIKQSAEAAVALSHGDFEHEMVPSVIPIAEVEELTVAFRDMAANLKDSFEKIQVSEEKYRLLIENIDDMIYSLTPEGQFIAINQKFEKELGIDRRQIIGNGLEVIFPEEEQLQFWKAQIAKVVDTQSRYAFPFAYVRQNGKRSIYNINLIPMFNIQGQVSMILGSNADITELVEAQEEIQALHVKEKETLEQMVNERTEELHQAMDELIEKEKMASLGSLVSGIAHEINTPLGVSVSAASYLAAIHEQTSGSMSQGTLTKSQLGEFFRNLEETSTILNTNLYRASELVKSFKEISINQITEDLTCFNFKDYLDMILLSLKHEYKNSGHTFEINCASELIVNSYPGVFAQIFTNLIMNALIHGLKSKEHGVIHIEVIREEHYMNIHFFDDGIGIEPEFLSRIFEPFFTTNRGKGGSGLGLNVVYNLVTGKLNGKISCQSKLGEGTHFYIRLPLILE